jgi:poly-gamma-glutamate capsule biosynthesis protein CapA/YwtB (metallophosphatase superfamily)
MDRCGIGQMNQEADMGDTNTGDIILFGAGDVGPSRSDLDSIFSHAAPVIQSGDLAFCQLEPVLTERGTPLPQARLTCSSSPLAAQAIRRAGFDVVSFATNHCMDWGRDGFFDTLDALAAAGLHQVGAGRNLADARKPVIIDIRSTKIAFLAYCSILPQDYWAKDSRAGCAPLRGHTLYEQIEHDQPGTPCRIHSYPHREDLKNMIADVRQARQNADLVIVSAHWGIHFKEAEIAECQKDYAYAAIDNGADLILGHHAHILKPVEVYRGKVIFYSLGNFAMEEVSNMKRDLAAYGQDHEQSQSFLEMKAIAPKWQGSSRSFPPDSYKSMLAKCVIRNGKIYSVSFLPVDIPEDNAPVILRPDQPKYQEIVDYMTMITRMEKLDTRYDRVGDEIFIQPANQD